MVFFLGVWSVRLCAQAPGAKDSLHVQAERMGAGLVSGNYGVFLRYLHPTAIRISGGEAALKGKLEQVVQQMNQNGMRFESVSVDAPGVMVKAGTAWQVTVKQHTRIRMSRGWTEVTSTLIGVSTDNGLHWKFLDTNNKTTADMKQLLPELSPAIVIPVQSPPVHYDQ
jgi:hypothetical protein